jgi:hypothetical protein
MKSIFQGRKWTYRGVVAAEYRKQIHDLALEISENSPESTHYFISYNAAYKRVEAGLTDEQRQKLKVMATEWSQNKLPPKVQRTYVHINLSRLELTDLFAPV